MLERFTKLEDTVSLQGFEVLPANDFLRMLWNDEIVNPDIL